MTSIPLRRGRVRASQNDPVPLRSLCAALCAAAVCWPAAALSHAYVVRSTPQANERLDVSPASVSVSFDEPVTIESGEPLDLRDARGAHVACARLATVDPEDATRVVCPLARELPRGAYTLLWRVTSADTHVVHGAIAFGVGVDAAAGAPSSTRASAASAFDPASPPAAVLRFLMLYGSLVACGAFAFRQEVVKRTAGSAVAAGRCAKVVLVAAAAALLASIPALAVQTIAANGAMPGSPASALLTTALYSQWGRAWLLRAIGLLSVGLLAWRPGAFARLAPLPLLAILASFSISGHALHGGDDRLAVANVIADLVHVAAAAAWIGGIVAFVAVLPLLAVERAVAAFSPIAVASVTALVLSGTYAAVVHLGTPQALLDNTYGLLVLGKIVILIALLVLGFRNLLRGNGRLAFDGFAIDLKIETALLVLVIGISAVLTGVAPPATPMSGMPTMRQ